MKPPTTAFSSPTLRTVPVWPMIPNNPENGMLVPTVRLEITCPWPSRLPVNCTPLPIGLKLPVPHIPLPTVPVAFASISRTML
ncbi:hypothetical protein G6F59_017313 [Rhizopus arrhizus]|nr:hypothetical protein G6F59_017313 [Rhizopus arrhizus]